LERAPHALEGAVHKSAASESVAILAFDSMETAQALAADVRAKTSHQSAVGIELISIRVVEVSASA